MRPSVFGVVPDILTCAKGLTNATVPMGAVAARAGIYDAVTAAAADGAIELFHGYTYSGHPLACAAGLAALDVYAEEGLFARASALEPVFEEAAHSLAGAPHVIDVRNIGMVAGIELAPRPGQPTARAVEAFARCFDQGVLIRTTGDTIAVIAPAHHRGRGDRASLRDDRRGLEGDRLSPAGTRSGATEKHTC